MIFKDTLIDKFKFTDAEVEFSKQLFAFEELGAKGYFLKEGEIAKKLGIVISGLFRTYYLSKDGDEVTTAFHEPYSLLLSINSFTNQVKSKENIIAIEKSEIMSITHSNWEILNKKVPKWEDVRKVSGDHIGMALQSRAREFQTLTAKERYLKFCKKHPMVIQKAALGQIASYLGIDIATLSRIRRRI